MDGTVVELEGVNGERFNLTTGDRGIYLGTDPKGLYDPPVKVVYEEPGNYPGSRYLNHRILRRDIVFGVEILNDAKVGTNSWLSRDSEWRKAWAFDRDCRLIITTPESGTRWLKLRLGEAMDIKMVEDPRKGRINRVAMVCIAGDPFWYEDDVVYSAVTQTDTQFDPNFLPWPWPRPSIPSEELTITVDPDDGKGGLNPTDQAIFLKWGVPGSVSAPAEPYVPGLPWLGAPKSRATLWTIPDYSFEDEELANRRIRLPGLIGGLRTNEVQAVFIDGKPTGGTFRLGFNGEFTEPISYSATANQIEAALVALAGIALNDVDVAFGKKTDELQVIEMGEATGGTWTITYDGETTTPLDHDASPDAVEAALKALPNIGGSDVSVGLKWGNEVQVMQIVGEPTDGSFKLIWDGKVTNPISHNPTALEIHLRMDELPGMGLADLSIDKDLFRPFTPYTITFVNAWKGQRIPLMTTDATGLSGGNGTDVKITRKHAGYRRYQVKFVGDMSGFNVPEMTVNYDNLTGTGDNTVKVYTETEGKRPFIVTFDNNLSGLDLAPLEVDITGLTGGTLSARVEELTKGRTAPAENAFVDTDPRVEQVTSESGSQLWSRMNGVRWRHPVPPYTRDKTFHITVSGCPPGQMVTLRIPRPWSRPWGLE